VRRFVDYQIADAAVRYYGGKHPKHHMWLGHNDYLLDNVRPGERVLDIGCGASYYTQQLADKASYVLGVDINPERVASSQAQNTKPNVEYKVMDVTRDLPAGTFDVAICSHVLEHLDDPVSFLQALAERVPRLIVKVPLEDTFWMKPVMKDIGINHFDDEDHRREYTLSLLREHLEAGGWHIDELLRGYDARALARSNCFSPQVSTTA